MPGESLIKCLICGVVFPGFGRYLDHLGATVRPCAAPDPDAIIERLDAELSAQRALTAQYREMAEERLAQVKRLEEVVGKAQAVLHKHDQWHQNIGTVIFPERDGDPGYELDLSAEYADSSLYEETAAALSLLDAGKPEAPKPMEEHR